MSPVKNEDVIVRLALRLASSLGRLKAAWSWRQRLIRLLSAGWVPPSVSSSRGFPRS